MYRLSLKLFVVLSLVAGPVLGFAPDASAHKVTGTVAAVSGDVGWPNLPKTGRAGGVANLNPAGLTCLAADSAVGPPAGGCAIADFDLFDRPGANFGDPDLTLDSRAGGVSPLNGCRLDGGNTTVGLRLTAPSHDLCFAFSELEIQSAGLIDGRKHSTDFVCVSSGQSTGGAALAGALQTLGAFYGEFTCNGSPGTLAGAKDMLEPGVPHFIPSADGHFHGLTFQGTIGFLGEIDCTVPPRTVPPLPLVGQCPTAPDDGTTLKSESHSGIKHTLACKGQVRPGSTRMPTLSGKAVFDKVDKDLITIPNVLAALKLVVALECVIA